MCLLNRLTVSQIVPVAGASSVETSTILLHDHARHWNHTAWVRVKWTKELLNETFKCLILLHDHASKWLKTKKKAGRCDEITWPVFKAHCIVLLVLVLGWSHVLSFQPWLGVLRMWYKITSTKGKWLYEMTEKWVK